MKSLISIILVVCVSTVFAQTTASDAIIGTWRIESGLDIDIYKQGSKYLGEIVALNGFNGGQVLDEFNSDDEKVNDSLIGRIIIFHLAYDEKSGTWDNGKMYAPHMGFHANLEIKSVEDNVITAVGSKLFLWHTENWEKIE